LQPQDSSDMISLRKSIRRLSGASAPRHDENRA
jgi:hypothetical protein